MKRGPSRVYFVQSGVQGETFAKLPRLVGIQRPNALVDINTEGDQCFCGRTILGEDRVVQRCVANVAHRSENLLFLCRRRSAESVTDNHAIDGFSRAILPTMHMQRQPSGGTALQARSRRLRESLDAIRWRRGAAAHKASARRRAPPRSVEGCATQRCKHAVTAQCMARRGVRKQSSGGEGSRRRAVRLLACGPGGRRHPSGGR
eukprot:3031189-Prymnesium_polylepis.2